MQMGQLENIKRGNYYVITAIVIFLFINTLGHAQNRRFSFQSLKPGISHQTVQKILMDQKGFMWFGTQDGLNKFDGSNFVIYENIPGDTCSLSNNTITALYEDKNGTIWIGTTNGLSLYNREKDNFSNIKLPNVDKTTVQAICADPFGNIWLGTNDYGLVQFNPQKNSFKFYNPNDSDNITISSYYVSDIVIDNQQNIWVGTSNGLDLLDNKGKILYHFKHSTDNNSLSNNNVNTLFWDKDETLWIGTNGGGLDKLTVSNGKYFFQHYRQGSNSKGLSNNNILSVCQDKKGNLWIGPENGGLNCFDPTTETFTIYHTEDGNPNSISGNSIKALYCDRNNTVWIGTYLRGCNYIDEKSEKFELYQRNFASKNALPHNSVTGFAEAANGNIWIATDGGGVAEFDLRSRKINRIINQSPDMSWSNSYVQTILYDKNENLWVGSWNGGIDRFDKSGAKIRNYRIEGIQKIGDNKVKYLYQDKQENIWAGTHGSGLFIYDTKVDGFVQVNDRLGSNNSPAIAYVTTIQQDSHDNIWIGTLYGLFLMKRNSTNGFDFTKFSEGNAPNSLNSSRITVIFEDSRRNLWLGTLDNGLNLLNKKDNSFTHFLKQDGLSGNSIKGILEDNAGNLWISTTKGISKFNPQSKRFRNYTKEDGLCSDQFQTNSCLKTKNGEFFFGGINGFNAFIPEQVKENNLIPPVYLTDFKLFNKSAQIGAKDSPLKKHIGETGKITLAYYQNSFTIDFVAINYTHSSQNQYAYILEGLENEWNNAGHTSTATYSYLKPGTYLFKVKGSNNDGAWNNSPTTLEIIILPPFWKTVWAYMLYSLALLSLLLLLIKSYTTRVKQQQQLQLDKMKLDFFTNITHEIRTPLTLILSPLETLVTSATIDIEIKNKLVLIYKNADRLFQMVNELMDFSKTESRELKILTQESDIINFTNDIFECFREQAHQKKIDYQFLSNEERMDVGFDPDKLETVFMNLLSNAFKFTPPEGKISVTVEKATLRDRNKTREYAKILVADNGIGISQKFIKKVFDRFYQSPDAKGLALTGTGIGLALSKNLVKLHHGKIEVVSEPYKRTCFSVYIPLGQSHFNKNEIRSTPSDISISVPSTNIAETNIHSPQNAPVVLIVEDNYDLRKYIVSQLSALYNILEANDGEEGYSLAINETPDLIISDVVMPKMSGIELCAKVKENIATSHIPLILLTAKVSVDDKIDGIQTGADAYITKPFHIRILEATIKNLIDSRNKLYQKFGQKGFTIPKELSNNTLDHDFLAKAIRFIEEHISNEELIVKDLASHLLLSNSQTYRKLKALTGQTVPELVRSVRLKMAVKLMETGMYNISEIGFKVGFTSPAYFSRCFREQYGMPPSKYLLKICKNASD
jgi:signal transduction histidine kinase/ligand-binding sensor domain-containing protein/DNA-binding response OmpR family regulator